MEHVIGVNDELQNTNEELHRAMPKQGRQNIRARSPDISSQDNSQPFSQEIMYESIPSHFITPKITPFFSVEDLESHLKAFKDQMLISGGSNVV